MDLGLPELTDEQVEAVSKAAEDAARRHIFGKVSRKQVENLTISVEAEGKLIDTGLRKFGTLMGDHTEVGCNAVLNPGSIIGRNSIVYANVNWRGVLPPDRIAKNRGMVEVVVRTPPAS